MRETYDHFCDFFKKILTPHVRPPRTDPKIARPVFFKLNLGGVMLKFHGTTLIFMISCLFWAHGACILKKNSASFVVKCQLTLNYAIYIYIYRKLLAVSHF